MMNRITVTVTPEITDALKRDARLRGCSVSESLRVILDNHFHLVAEPGAKRKVGFARLGASDPAEGGTVSQRVDQILADEIGA